MQQNTCYEDHTVYEEVQLQDKTEIRLKPNEKFSSSSADKINRLTLKKETNLKTKCCLIVVLSLLAIAMVAAMALSAYALVSSNQGMDSLMLDFQELKMQLNKTKEASETEIAKLKTALETNGVNTLTATNNATMALVNSLQSSVSSLNTANGATTTQLNSLQSSVSTLEGVLNGLGPGQVGAAINAIISLQSSVSSLTTRVNSPVNLYQNCIQETISCTNTQSSSVYMKHCQTTTLPVNKPGYYTLSMACKFDPIPHYYDTTALRQSGSNVQCLCWTTSLTSSGEHASASFFTFTCRLVITRCPTSQNIV